MFSQLRYKATLLFRSESELTKRYFEQLSGTFVLRVLSMLVSLLYVPVVLDFVKDEKYGVWVTLTTIINWIKLFDVGLGNGLRNMLAGCIAVKDIPRGKQYVSTTYFLLALIFLGIILVFIPLNQYLDWNAILKIDSIPPGELKSVTTVSFILVLVGFVLQTVVVIFDAHGNTVLGGVMQLVANVLSLFLIWGAKYFAESGDLLYLSCVLTGLPVLVYLAFTVYCFGYRYKELKPDYREVRFQESKNLFSLSGKFFLIQITAAILFSSIPFIVNRFYSPREVTQYSIVSSLFNLPVIVITLIAFPVSPLVTQAYAKGDVAWIRSMLKRIRMFALAVSAGTLLLFLVSPLVFSLWIGDRVAIPSMLSLAVCVYTIIYITNTPYSVFLNSTGKVKLLVWMGPVTITIFISCCFLFKAMFNQVYSVALAMIVANLSGLVLMPLTLKKAINDLENERKPR